MPGYGTRRFTRTAQRRSEVRLQKRERDGEDDRGKPIYTWEDVIPDLRVRIRHLEGTEVELARQLYAHATLRVEFHADSRVKPEMRFLKADGRQIYIGAVDNVEDADREMVCLCSEIVE